MAYKFQLGAYTASGSLKQEGAFECDTSITIGSAALTEAELEFLDGITAGTAAASKVVVLDGSKNIATIGTVGCAAITSTGASSFGASTLASLTCTAAATFVGGLGASGARRCGGHPGGSSGSWNGRNQDPGRKKHLPSICPGKLPSRRCSWCRGVVA